MKKLIISIVALLVFPSIALAYFQPATLTDGVNKVVVTSETQAKAWFAQGYHLFTGKELGALTSNLISSNYLEVNKDGVYHITGTFIDASTTLVSFINPFGANATATVEMVRLVQTGAATSSYSVVCGAADGTDASANYALLSSETVATSSNNTIIENDIATGLSGMAGGGSVSKVMLTKANKYFTCIATEVGSAGGLTNGANTFAGKFMVRISRMR